MWRAMRLAVKAAAPLTFGSTMLCTAAADPPCADSPLVTTFPFGLTGPGTTHKYYTTALDMSAPVLKRGSGDFMAAARLDARERLGLAQGATHSANESRDVEANVRKHLSSAGDKCAAFLSSAVVHDRKEMTTELVGVLKKKGELALLLGGKNVGKSQLLAELTRRTDIVGSNGTVRAVLYVDARRFNMNLAAGLEAALLGEKEELVGGEWWAGLGNLGVGRRRPQESRPEARAVGSPPISSASVAPILRGIGIEAKFDFSKETTVMEANLKMLDRVVTLAGKQGLYLCLVVDEVDLAFPTPHPQTSLTHDEKRALSETKVFLERLVMLTKQSRSINVLLVSSEYSYPYRLRHDGFFNTSNLTATLYAGEVPPADMRALLRDTWGLGPCLSDVFLAFYGGHIHLASQALHRLESHLDDFKCFSVAPDGAVGAIAAALVGSGSSSTERGKARALLRSAAQRGFAPVREEGDASAQALARANLGGLVKCESLVVGLPESVRGGSSFGFVPSSQFLRNVIARDLYNDDKAKGWLSLGGWY